MDVYKIVGSSKRQINQYQQQIRHLETSCSLLQLKSGDTAANFCLWCISHWIEEYMHIAQGTEDVSEECHLCSVTISGIMRRPCVLRKGKHSPGVHCIDPIMTGSHQPPDEGRCLHAQNTHLAQLASLMSFSLNKLKIK